MIPPKREATFLVANNREKNLLCIFLWNKTVSLKMINMVNYFKRTDSYLKRIKALKGKKKKENSEKIFFSLQKCNRKKEEKCAKSKRLFHSLKGVFSLFFLSLLLFVCLEMEVNFVVDPEESVLSEEQKELFKRDGFLVLENFFSEKQVNALEPMTNELENMPDVRDSIWKYWNMQPPVEGKKSERFLDRIENFVDKHEKWEELFLNPNSKLVKAVSELFGEEAVLWKEKLNFKKPGSSGFAPHQDAQAGWLEHNQTIHISVGVSVDETTKENGCLEMVRGKHKDGLIGPVRGNMPQDVVDCLEWHFLPTKQHTIVLFDSFVPHRSEPNRTQKDRRVCLSTYSKKSEADFYTRETYFQDKLKTAPPDVYKAEGESYRGYLI